MEENFLTRVLFITILNEKIRLNVKRSGYQTSEGFVSGQLRVDAEPPIFWDHMTIDSLQHKRTKVAEIMNAIGLKQHTLE